MRPKGGGIMFPKLKRERNPELMRTYRKAFCQICGEPAKHNHHIFTRGSYGPDAKWNLICLCPECHNKAHSGNIPKVNLLLIKVEQLRVEEKSIDFLKEIEAMLSYSEPRLKKEDYELLAGEIEEVEEMITETL